ncbi:MAG: LPS export ABC transporter ATP-binding protein [Acidobacteriota bacterium]
MTEAAGSTSAAVGEALDKETRNEPAEVVEALRAENLKKSYRGRCVVNNVSITVRPGEVVGLLGPNGAGKTTTFYMIVGLESPDAGRILLETQDITRLPMYKRARRGVSYLPQEPSIFRKLTVEENILAILETLKISRAERQERLELLLEDFHLNRIRRNRGFALSGGERRRTEIARCLTIEPRIILLDEPFAGIDPIAIDEIQRLILRLRDRGIGVLVTDHNVREALTITDRAYIINEGELFRAGTPHELTTDPEVRRVYLGEKFRM